MSSHGTKRKAKECPGQRKITSFFCHNVEEDNANSEIASIEGVESVTIDEFLSGSDECSVERQNQKRAEFLEKFKYVFV